MTENELQTVVAAVIQSLKTNGKTIAQLTPVTSLANSDSLEVSGGKKIAFSKLKELVASAVVVTQESIKSWVVIESTDDLPEEPTPEEQMKAYVLADESTLYVYVGEGGDTLGGKWQSAQLQGPKGNPGTPLGETEIVDDLDSDAADKVLSAKQGKVLKGMIGNIEIPVVNDLTTGGEASALSAEMGKELGKRAVVDIVGEGVIRVTRNRDLTLDDVCYEGKTYRQIFEGESTFLYDAEETFAAAGVEEYRNKSVSNIPTRSTSVVDSGEHSIYCHQVVGTSSCLRQASNNTKLMQVGKTYYIALRINQLSLTFGSGQTRNPIVVCESDVVCVCNEATNGWITLSGTWTNPFSSTQGKLYFGLFGGSDGEAYIDSVVAVPMHMFITAPNKEQMDSFYNTYVQIKKHTANSSDDTTTTITSSPEMVNRSLLVNYGFTDLECMQEFMRELNAKAYQLGMIDSNFSNPYGGDKYGYNWTTVEDMMKMIVYATSYPRVLDYMSQNTQVDLPIYGARARMEVFPTTANAFNDAMQSAYEVVHGAGATMPYYVNSRKGAGWGNLDNKDATSRTRGMVGTAVVDGHNVAFCIFGCSTAYPNANTANRIYNGIVDLLDICKAHFDGTTVGAQSYIGYFNYAMAIELPASQNECHKNNIGLDVIYKKSVIVDDMEVKFHTASAIKVLTAMVLFDALGYDLHQVIEVNSYDENYDNTFWNPNDSGSFEGHAGDKCTFSTALYAILGWSNGVFTLAAARAAGAKMLYNKLLKDIS